MPPYKCLPLKHHGKRTRTSKMFSSEKVALHGPDWTPGFIIRGSRVFGDIWNEDVRRLERCRLDLGEKADGRNQADTMRFPFDVTIVDREGF